MSTAIGRRRPVGRRAYKNPQKNARRYEDAGGALINVSYMIAHKGISATRFKILREKAERDGKPLTPHPRQIPVSPGTEKTYREAEVDALNSKKFPVNVKEGVWLDKDTFEPDKRWLKNKLGRKKLKPKKGRKKLWTCLRVPSGNGNTLLGVPVQKVYAWISDYPCPKNRDAKGTAQKLTAFQVTKPFPMAGTGLTCTVIVKEELEDVVKNEKEADRITKGGIYKDKKGRNLLTRNAAEGRGLSIGAQYYWEGRTSIIRKGQPALRTNEIPFLHGPGLFEIDVTAILDGSEFFHRGLGRGHLAATQRIEDRANALAALEVILGNLKAGEGMPPSDVFARAKSEFDVGRAAVRRVFKDVGKPIPGGQRQNVLWRLARPPRRRVNGRASIPRNVKEPTLPKKKRGERGKGKNTAAKHKKVVDLALTRRFSSLRQLQDALPFLMSRGRISEVLKEAGITFRGRRR